jgi:hypothetical protein
MDHGIFLGVAQAVEVRKLRHTRSWNRLDRDRVNRFLGNSSDQQQTSPAIAGQLGVEQILIKNRPEI